MSGNSPHQLSEGEILRRPRITAVVNSGKALTEAGIQIKSDGKILSAHILPFANKKRPLRFCVGHPNARSSFWSAFANRGSSDVYVGIRSSADLHKISLHESGDFRYQLIGMTQEALDRPDLAFLSTSGAGGGGRILHKWHRPDTGPHGWTDCLSIVIPAEDLEPGPASARDLKDVVWIPAPQNGRAVEVRGFLVQPGDGELDLGGLVREDGGFSLLGGFKLAGGQVFVLLSATATLHPEVAAMFAGWRSSRDKAHPGFDWSPENHPRVLAFAAGADGYPTFFDVRVERVSTSI